MNRIAALVILIATGWAHAQDVRYAVMIDAGSTGSRAFIYAYTQGGAQQLPEVSLVKNPVCDGWCMHKISPGIGSLSHDPHAIGRHVGALVQYAQTTLEQLGADPKTTQLYFQATGGVRSLTPAQRDVLLGQVQAALASSQFDLMRVEALTGGMEGAYSWINVNYLHGNFEPHNRHQPKLGVLEMGGESLQVVFETDTLPQLHGVQLKMGDDAFVLYAHGYDGLGGQTARRRYKTENCSHENRKPGAANAYDVCRSDLSAALSHDCPHEDGCGMFGVYQPKARGVFFGIDHVSNIPAILKLDAFSARTIDERARVFCEKGWEDVKGEHGHVKEEYLSNLCFESAFLSVLLTGDGAADHVNNLGFGDLGENIVAPKSVDGKVINWTLGSLVYHLMQ